jgi:hypothetical protein
MVRQALYRMLKMGMGRELEPTSPDHKAGACFVHNSGDASVLS